MSEHKINENLLQQAGELLDKLREKAQADGEDAFRLPPVTDARRAAALIAACDVLQDRICRAEQLVNPLHQPHKGNYVLFQRIMRWLMRPTLEHQSAFNMEILESLRRMTAMLQMIVAYGAPTGEESK